MTTKPYNFIFTFLFFILSCNLPNSKNKLDKSVKDNILIYADSLNQLDTTNYEKSIVIYTKDPDSFFDNSSNNFRFDYLIDSFSANNITYRTVYYNKFTSDTVASLEQLINGKWYKKIAFENSRGYRKICYNLDVNRDGFIDLTRQARWTKEVYFFIAKNNNFIDTISANLNDDVFLIDSSLNIYSDFQRFRGSSGDISSTLYTFKEYKKINLFNLFFDNTNDLEPDLIKNLILSKCINGNIDSLEKIKTIKLAKPISTNDEKFYDYKLFWKNEYKKLLGYS